MELQKQHREALINQLEKANDEKILTELIMSKKKDNDFDGWHEIRLFMVLQKIKLIEQSLINNEIDF